MGMRPLSLHVSALNDDEYATFTSSLEDLAAPDAASPGEIHYEKLSVTSREARAWLRGRYPDLPLNDLDAILRLFAPPPGQEPVLSGNQFFAILRLVLHVRSGAELDRNLVFTQVHPTLSKSRSQSPLKRPPPRPAPPTRPRQSSASTTFDVPTSDTNPFHHAPNDHSTPMQPPVHPDRRPSPPATLPAAPNHHTSNPFVNRAKTTQSATSPVVAAVQLDSKQSAERKLPPLPPRKPPVIPPRTSSILVPSASSSTALAAQSKPPPPPPILPKVPHLTTALMKTSLQASKAAQTAKKAEAERESTRILQVLKSSNAGHSRSRSPTRNGSNRHSSTGSMSSSDERQSRPALVPALPPRRKLSPPPSSAASTRSFESIANATLSNEPAFASAPAYGTFTRKMYSSTPAASRSPSRSPSRPTTDLPPPMHPDRKLLPRIGVDPPSPVSRMTRSKSMHQSSPPPIPPPLRRKRPESVQLPPSPSGSPMHSAFFSAGPPSTASATSAAGFPRLSRHLSLSAKREGGPESTVADLRKTFSGLGPKFDKARYKAEAGLSRRGYVPSGGLWREEGEERLVGFGARERMQNGARRGDGAGGDSGDEEGVGVDEDSTLDGLDDEEDALGLRGRNVERDEMKWPAGEGWKPL